MAGVLEVKRMTGTAVIVRFCGEVFRPDGLKHSGIDPGIFAVLYFRHIDL